MVLRPFWVREPFVMNVIKVMDLPPRKTHMHTKF